MLNGFAESGEILAFIQTKNVGGMPVRATGMHSSNGLYIAGEGWWAAPISVTILPPPTA